MIFLWLKQLYHMQLIFRNKKYENVHYVGLWLVRFTCFCLGRLNRALHFLFGFGFGLTFLYFPVTYTSHLNLAAGYIALMFAEVFFWNANQAKRSAVMVPMFLFSCMLLEFVLHLFLVIFNTIVIYSYFIIVQMMFFWSLLSLKNLNCLSSFETRE